MSLPARQGSVNENAGSNMVLWRPRETTSRTSTSAPFHDSTNQQPSLSYGGKPPVAITGSVSSVRTFISGEDSTMVGEAHSQHLSLPDEGISALDPVEFLDIDVGDVRNPQACTEYVNEIYAYLRESEVRDSIPINYMPQQSELTERRRAALVDWILDLHYGFKLSPDSLFLAINMIDRFLGKRVVTLNKLLLLGVSSIFLACKFEETPALSVTDFIVMAGGMCSRKSILKMEAHILDTLKYALSVPTTLTFLKRFAKAADATNQIGMLSRFLSELSLHDYAISTQYPPSLVAAAAISLALRIVRRPSWTSTMQHYSGYTEAQLSECLHDIARLVLRLQYITAPRTVWEKYSSTRYLAVAPFCLRSINDQFPAIATELAAYYQQHPEPQDLAFELPDLSAIREQEMAAMQQEEAARIAQVVAQQQPQAGTHPHPGQPQAPAPAPSQAQTQAPPPLHGQQTHAPAPVPAPQDGDTSGDMGGPILDDDESEGPTAMAVVVGGALDATTH